MPTTIRIENDNIDDDAAEHSFWNEYNEWHDNERDS